MLPEVRKLIKENQKLLYTFRKGGTNLPQKQKLELCKYLDKAFKTVSTKMQTLKEHKIILNDNFVINSEFAYFAGFYITETEIEVELIDFQFEPVLQKLAPDFPHKIFLEKNDNCLLILQDLVEKLSDIVPFVAGSIVFDKCMNYDENIAYCIREHSLLIDRTSLLLSNSLAFLPKQFKTIVQVDAVLAYTLYLREKIFESSSIAYYDLTHGQIGYVKHNILSKEVNPVCGLVFPRYTDEQEELLKTLESLSDERYEVQLDAIQSSGILSIFDQASFQISSILNPAYLIIDGKWVKSPHFYDFYRKNSQFFATDNEIANILRLDASWPIIMKKEEQPQKGGAIYAAYSFFDWKLEW